MTTWQKTRVAFSFEAYLAHDVIYSQFLRIVNNNRRFIFVIAKNIISKFVVVELGREIGIHALVSIGDIVMIAIIGDVFKVGSRRRRRIVKKTFGRVATVYEFNVVAVVQFNNDEFTIGTSNLCFFSIIIETVFGQHFIVVSIMGPRRLEFEKRLLAHRFVFHQSLSRLGARRKRVIFDASSFESFHVQGTVGASIIAHGVPVNARCDKIVYVFSR